MSARYSLESPFLQGELSPFAHFKSRSQAPEPIAERILSVEEAAPEARAGEFEAEFDAHEVEAERELEAEWLDRELEGLDDEAELTTGESFEPEWAPEGSETAEYGEVIEVEAEAEEVEAAPTGELASELTNEAEQQLSWFGEEEQEAEAQRFDDELESFTLESSSEFDSEAGEDEFEKGSADKATGTVTVLLDGAANPDDQFRLQSSPKGDKYKKALKAKDAVDVGNGLRALRFDGVGTGGLYELWHERSSGSRRIVFMKLRLQDLTKAGQSTPNASSTYYPITTQVPDQMADRYGNPSQVDPFLVAPSPLLVELKPQEPKF
ncbi:MAG: hypothetical protein QM756_34970 [Polyangiaceae bacterium]